MPIRHLHRYYIMVGYIRCEKYSFVVAFYIVAHMSGGVTESIYCRDTCYNFLIWLNKFHLVNKGETDFLKKVFISFSLLWNIFPSIPTIKFCCSNYYGCVTKIPIVYVHQSSNVVGMTVS